MGKQTKQTEAVVAQVEQKTAQKKSKKTEEVKPVVIEEEKPVVVDEEKQEETEHQTDVSQTKFEEHLVLIQDSVNELKKKLQTLNSELKRLETVHKSELKRARTKKNKRSEKHKPTGFARLRPVSGRLAEFIGEKDGSELSGPAITQKVWNELKRRGLTYGPDHRVIHVDDEVSEIFFVDKAVNKSTNPRDYNGFNFGNVQFYIKQAMEGKRLEKPPRKEKPKQEQVETKTKPKKEKSK